MDEGALTYALRLLRRRDYSRRELARRIDRRSGAGRDPILDWLEGKGYLDDRRFSLSFVESHPGWSRRRVDAALEERGVDEAIRNEVLDSRTWPSVGQVVSDRMSRMGLRAPLDREQAARIARALSRVGYDPAEIEEALERLL